MTGKEKAIKGLECCSAMSGYKCRECPYWDECHNTDLPYGMSHLADDALELIKSQDKLIRELKIKVTVLDETLTGVTAAWADTLRRIDRV